MTSGGYGDDGAVRDQPSDQCDDACHDATAGSALAIVISGAPGSGKTTLARSLSETMRLPHLNKDLAAAGLVRSGLTYELANKRAFEVIYGTARSWLQTSMSLVMDMTMYSAYSPAEVGSLLPHGVVVNVHCYADDALFRWEAKMRRSYPAEDVEAVIARGYAIMADVTDPLDFGCDRIEVDTTDGYRPALPNLIHEIERTYVQHTTHPLHHDRPRA